MTEASQKVQIEFIDIFPSCKSFYNSLLFSE